MLETPPKTRFPLNKKQEKKTSEPAASASAPVSSKQPLVDVAESVVPALESEVEWVGMEGMELPVRWQLDGEVLTVPSLVDGFVSLNDKKSKGIHMSRIYRLLMDTLTVAPLTSGSDLRELLASLIGSQKGLSQNARLQIHFSLPVKTKALISGQSGFRSYPVTVGGETVDGELYMTVNFKVLYSSTCPCSAALSRQLNQEHFLKIFGSEKSLSPEQVAEWMGTQESVVATPHAQRSEADIQLRLSSDFEFSNIQNWIESVEEVLATPVQTAVKREDEQEFARLNATNLMFCEDAARRLKHLFQESPELKGYFARVRHMESLHPHDAVAVIQG